MTSTASASLRRPPLPIAVALRRAFQRGYDLAALRADLLAGMVVGVVALPLSMALAIAVGVPPQQGLYTAIVGGAVAALAGGSKVQVTGPTAAFVVILAPIASQYGLSGLLTAGMLAGVILLAMGFGGLGRLVQFVPDPVTIGFTAGIAVVIATLQLKDVFGLPIAHMPDGFPEKVQALWAARGAASWRELTVAATTLGLLLGVPRVERRVPAPLIAIVAVSFGTWATGVDVATIGSRFHTVVDGREIAGIPSVLPSLHAPWGDTGFSFALVRQLLPSAFAIAMLGAIESLLSAVVADGMTGKRHDSDAELVGQGLANVIVPFFGGIAATGALARTATAIRSGARSPIAALTHSAVVLLAVVLLAPLVAYVPMASLAALLLLVAWNMAEIRHIAHMARVAPRADVLLLAVCFGLTVVFDMVLAVGVGVVLAALLFAGRMADETKGVLLQGADGEEVTYALPPHVAVFEVAGALFFGAAREALSTIESIGGDVRVVVLGLGRTGVIDASGLVALESALEQLRRHHRFVIITGPLPEPHEVFARAALERKHEHVLFADDVQQGIDVARDLVALNPQWGASPARPPATA